MRNLLVIIFFFAASAVCNAQNDSLLLAHLQWETTPVSKGVVLKTFAFNNNLFGANQYISILEIKQKKRRIGIAADKKILSITSDFGQSSKAIAALNGTFFDIANGGSVDYIRMDGNEINTTRLSANGGRASHQRSAVVINKGKLSVAPWDGTPDWEKKIPGEDVMVTGPLLIWNKNYSELDTSSLVKMRHPRSAVARVKNKALFITVDGRSDMAAGMTLKELATFMHWIHASEGINLDGGGSTTLWVDGKGVINHPSDNKKWDHEGQRKVANVLIVKGRK